MTQNLTIYLLRHGQTTHSRDNKYCGAGTDADLTPDGSAMAKAFSEVYRTHPFRAIYCSSMKRARDTATPVANALKQSLIVREGLREIDYGAWEGLEPEKVPDSEKELQRKWLDDPVHFSPPQGETAPDILKRANMVIDEIRANHQSGDVLVVSHKTVIRIVLCSLLEIPLVHYRARLACPVCSLSSVEFTKTGPLLRTLGDRAHLSEELQRLPGS